MQRIIYWLGVALSGLALVFVLAACGTTASSASSDAAPELVGSQWQLTQLNGQPPRATGEPISLGFEANQRAGGNGGCNSFGGTYTLNGSDLTFGALMSTQRACLDQALNAQEAAYYQALQSVASYELGNDQLSLKDARGTVVLVFSRA